MDEYAYYKHKKRKLRSKWMRYFRKTISHILCLAVIAAIAYGLLVHFEFNFMYQYVATHENGHQGDSSGQIIAGDNNETAWNLILVNKWHPIPEDYDVDLTPLSNREYVDTRIYPELQEMFDDARKDGIYPVVAAGYRTAEKQQSLLDQKVSELKAEGYCADDAESKAETWVALPGTSEHQLGIAVDINADGIHSAGTEVYEWLSENAWKYGFILRYPSDKTDISGTSYEPWHYRYVGKETAAEIYRQDLCLEEYLDAGNSASR